MKEGRVYLKGAKNKIIDTGVLSGAFDIPDDVFDFESEDIVR